MSGLQKVKDAVMNELGGDASDSTVEQKAREFVASARPTELRAMMPYIPLTTRQLAGLKGYSSRRNADLPGLVDAAIHKSPDFAWWILYIGRAVKINAEIGEYVAVRSDNGFVSVIRDKRLLGEMIKRQIMGRTTIKSPILRFALMESALLDALRSAQINKKSVLTTENLRVAKSMPKWKEMISLRGEDGSYSKVANPDTIASKHGALDIDYNYGYIGKRMMVDVSSLPGDTTDVASGASGVLGKTGESSG
jgi:hypothetical protein